MSTLPDTFLQSVIASGLVPASDVQRILDGIPEAERQASAETVGQHLVAAGKLTPYQVRIIRDGALPDLFINQYVVLDRLGAGGMGTVYKALHRRMKRVVAIKVLARSSSQDAAFLQRFQREVEAIARLSHPNIVLAYDADEAEIGHYLVMEFVAGSDLAQLVQARGPLSVSAAVDCLMQTARALEYAHAQGIIHRDIKPGNLLRDHSGNIKLADLGLARFNDALSLLSTGDGWVTHPGSIAGTVDFMSPEQARNTKLADHRADIYSLGCTLYFLLTGQRPYHGETLMETLLAHVGQSIPPLGTLRPDVPPALEDIYKKMLSKQPEQRQQTATELLREFEVCALPSDSAGESKVNSASDLRPRSTSLSGADAPTTIDPTPSERFVEISVLLVVSSRTQSRVISDMLRQLGIRQVGHATGGAEALATLAAMPSDLVISTMELPDMTALEFLENMRGTPQLRDVPFVLISSESDSPQLDRVRDDRAFSVLPKPFDAKLLNWAIQVATNVPRSATTVLTKAEMAGLRVLLVDDSAVARRQLARILTDIGVGCITEAADGDEAQQRLEHDTFDVVITDYMMPRVDGQELLRYIRQSSTQKALPVVMVTSVSDESTLSGVHRLGISALCNKELKPETLRDIIAGVLTKELPGTAS